MYLRPIRGHKTCSYWIQSDRGELIPIEKDKVYREGVTLFFMLRKHENGVYSIEYTQRDVENDVAK